MNDNDSPPSGEDTHDRLIRLEERLKIWMASVERRLGVTHQVMMWALGALGMFLIGLVSALLLRTP